MILKTWKKVPHGDTNMTIKSNPLKEVKFSQSEHKKFPTAQDYSSVNSITRINGKAFNYLP